MGRKKVRKYSYVWQNKHLKTGYLKAPSLKKADERIAKRKTDAKIIGYISVGGLYIPIRPRRMKK